jgi:hypothetical protein
MLILAPSANLDREAAAADREQAAVTKTIATRRPVLARGKAKKNEAVAAAVMKLEQAEEKPAKRAIMK